MKGVSDKLKIIILSGITISELAVLSYILSVIFNVNFSNNKTGMFLAHDKFNQDWYLPEIPIQFIRSSNNSLLQVELVPNYIQYFEGYQAKFPRRTLVKINSDGLRDYDHLIEKPNDTIRILIVGDSQEFGWGVELEESYPKVLERLLNENCNGKKYEVISLAVPGYDIWQKVELFRVKGLKYSPDIIILGLGTDDLVSSSLLKNELSLADKNIINEFIKLRESGKNLSSEDIEKIKIKNHLDIVAKQNAIVSNLNKTEILSLVSNAIQQLREIQGNSSIVFFIRILRTPEFKDAIKSISAENDWYYIFDDVPCDKYETYETNKENTVLYPLDIHPNAIGHKKLAYLLYCNLKKLNLIC